MTEKFTKEELVSLFVASIVTYLFAFSFFSFHIALPAIQKEFGNSLAAVQWISIIGTVMVSSLSLCFGRLGDLGARTKLYRLGVALYAVGSGLCVLAASFPQLIVFRVVMTLGLAMAFPLSGAILVSRFSPGRRGRGLGLLASAMAVGRISGPTLGGLILALWSWRGIFMASSLLGVTAFIAVSTLLKGEDKRSDEAFDLWGSLSLLIGYPALLIGLSLGPSTGWQSFHVLFWFSLSIAGWVSFFVIEFRAEKPLIRPSFFKIPSLSVAMLCLIIISAVISPVFIFAPLYMRNVLELSPFMIGLILTIPPLFIAVLSPVSGWFADRFEGRILVTVGLCFVLLGIFFYSRSGPLTTSLWVGFVLSLIGIGNALFIPANQRVAFSSVNDVNYGVVSAMVFTFGMASGSLGTTIAVAILEGRLGESKLLVNPTNFTEAQQFTFAWLVPLAVIGLLISLAGRLRWFTRSA